MGRPEWFSTKMPPQSYCEPARHHKVERVTMWNTSELRKVSGNAAPKAHNVESYMRKHPEMEVYNGQLNYLDAESQQAAAETRVAIWNKQEHKIYSGNAAPLAKNLAKYLARHPECEVYSGQLQKKRKMDAPGRAEPRAVCEPAALPEPAPMLELPQKKLSAPEPLPFTNELFSVGVDEELKQLGASLLPASLHFGWDQQLAMGCIGSVAKAVGPECPEAACFEGLGGMMDIDEEQLAVPTLSCLHTMESCFQAP